MPVPPVEVALIAVHKCNAPRLVTMLSALPSLACHRSYSRRSHPMCWLMRLKGSRKLSRATSHAEGRRLVQSASDVRGHEPVLMT